MFFLFSFLFSSLFFFFSLFRGRKSSRKKCVKNLSVKKRPTSNDSGGKAGRRGQTPFSAQVLFEAFVFCFSFLFSLFSVGVEQLHPTEEGENAAPPKGRERGQQHAKGEGKAAPPEGGGGRRYHAIREGKTQHYPKKEAKQHHATETAPPEGGEEGQHPPKKEREMSNTTQAAPHNRRQGKISPTLFFGFFMIN